MRRLLVIPLLVLGVLAGCGDDSDALSKDEYVERGDAACARLNDAIGEVPEPETEEAFVEALDTFHGLFTDFRDDLAELTPPEDAEDLHEQFQGVVDDSIETVEEARTLAEDGDVEGAGEALESMDSATEELNAELEDYGFVDCAEE